MKQSLCYSSCIWRLFTRGTHVFGTRSIGTRRLTEFSLPISESGVLPVASTCTTTQRSFHQTHNKHGVESKVSSAPISGTTLRVFHPRMERQLTEQLVTPDDNVLEFLGTKPHFQQLPFAAVKDIARAGRFMKLRATELQSLEQGVYIVWDGQVLTRTSSILQPGDYGTSEELEGSFLLGESLRCLFLGAQHAHLISFSSSKLWRMSDSATSGLLQLTKLKVDSFLGVPQRNLLTFGKLYGGHTVAQALAAATKATNPNLSVHSLHSYFLRPGENDTEVTYDVQRVQDGRNFAKRYVTAIQKNRAIFSMLVSFQRHETGLEHQITMPSAPPPEEVLPDEILHKSYLSDSRVPLSIKNMMRDRLSQDRLLDVRCCDPVDLIQPEASHSRNMVWFRAKDNLPNDQALHCCVAAYASDWIFIECALRPHGLTVGPEKVFLVSQTTSFHISSLDHSIWFHKPIKADDWNLFTMESPCAFSSRAMVTGHIFSRNGELLMSVAQEGLIRTSKL